MRIAFISTILHYPWGGADSLWTRAAEAASARGDSLFLSLSPLTAEHPRIVALRAVGTILHLRTSAPSLPSLTRRAFRKLGLAPVAAPDADLIAALARFTPDLVVFSQGGTYDLLQFPALVAWLRAHKIPFRLVANWQSEHPSLSESDLVFTRDALSAADLVAFVSTRNLDVTRRHLLAPLPNASVLHNPLRWQPTDTTPFAPASEARLATVSRLDEGKGLHLLLHALAEAGPYLPPWRLEIFGLGRQEPSLRAIIAHLGLADRAVLRGYIGSLREIWATNHLLCATAIDDGVPMTIPEAMLCERPVLATCVGGAEDWLAHGHTGYLCPAPTLPLLTTCLREAFADSARWPELGRTARVEACSRYHAADYLRLIN